MKNFNRLGLAAITSLALSLPVGAWAQATPKAAAPAKPAAAKTAAKPAPTTIEEQVVVRTWRQVTPESAQAMRDGAVQSLRLIRAARADIAKKQDKAARAKLETALTALQGVKSLEPITSVRTKVDNAANGAEVDAIALYRRDVVPVAAVVSAHETITDLGQVKAAMASTDQAATSGNGAATKAELIKVRTRLDAAIAEMPVTKTFDRVAAAAEALRKKQPRTADRLLAEAQNDIVVKVVDIRRVGVTAVPVKAKAKAPAQAKATKPAAKKA
ncbi:MAG: YfdX family protein [Alphaproteobacteria bacterium]|jgi:hypothetical protein|nr:YfdX family protein [Alphaproteobacteria bacterium]